MLELYRTTFAEKISQKYGPGTGRAAVIFCVSDGPACVSVRRDTVRTVAEMNTAMYILDISKTINRCACGSRKRKISCIKYSFIKR